MVIHVCSSVGSAAVPQMQMSLHNLSDIEKPNSIPENPAEKIATAVTAYTAK